MSYRDQFLTSDSRLPPGAQDRRLAAALSPRRLEVFRVTAATGSVTGAARLLDLSQPTVSQHLRALESELGVALFDRRANGLTLTVFGSAFLKHAVAVLRQHEELAMLLADTSVRRVPPLRIAGIPSVLRSVLPMAMEAAVQAGEERIFDVLEGTTAAMIASVEAGQADVALVDLNCADLLPAGVAMENLMHDPWYLVGAAGKALPLFCETSRLQNTRQLPWQTVQLSCGSRADQSARAWFDRMAPGHSVVARARSYPTMISLVKAGLGVCLAPALTLAAEDIDEVQRRPADLPPRRIAAVFPARRKCRVRDSLINKLIETCSRQIPAGRS